MPYNPELFMLEEVSIYWNIRSEKLWNMERNTALKTLHITDAKRMTLKPDLVKTSSTLETIHLGGSIFNNFPLE